MTREEALTRANEMIAAKVSAVVLQALRDRDALAEQIMVRGEASPDGDALQAALSAIDATLGGFAATMKPAEDALPGPNEVAAQ